MRGQPDKSDSSVHITLRITPEMNEELEEMQEENHGVAKSKIVRAALREYLKSNGKEGKY